jgi:hypothetical protein
MNIGIRPPKGCLMYGPPGTGTIALPTSLRTYTCCWLMAKSLPLLVIVNGSVTFGGCTRSSRVTSRGMH